MMLLDVFSLKEMQYKTTNKNNPLCRHNKDSVKNNSKNAIDTNKKKSF